MVYLQPAPGSAPGTPGSAAARPAGASGFVAKGLDAAAAKHGLSVVTADWFSRSDSLAGIGQSPEFMGEIFSVREKSPPESAPTSQGYAVFELTGVKPPASPAFADIRDRVTADFKNDRARQLLLQKAQELSDRAHATHEQRCERQMQAKKSNPPGPLGVHGLLHLDRLGQDVMVLGVATAALSLVSLAAMLSSLIPGKQASKKASSGRVLAIKGTG